MALGFIQGVISVTETGWVSASVADGSICINFNDGSKIWLSLDVCDHAAELIRFDQKRQEEREAARRQK